MNRTSPFEHAPLIVLGQAESSLEQFNQLTGKLLDFPEAKEFFQRLFNSTIPQFTPENADLLSRMALRVSVDLPPVPESQPSMQEYKGSLSPLVKHRVRLQDIMDGSNDE